MFLVAFFMFTTLLRVFLLASTSVSAKAVFPRAANATRAVVQKRFGDARFTFFDTGLGACGSTNVASDFIVALNSEQYGNGEHCYEMVEITYKGKTKQAQIVDECPGCPYAALDMSTGLFDFFASEDLGVIYGSWVFAGSTSGTTKKTSPTRTLTTSKKTLTAAGPSTARSSTSVASTSSPSATLAVFNDIQGAFGALLGVVVAGASL